MAFGKPATAEKWITDAAENEFYKTRAESDGFVFVSTISISESSGGTTLASSHDSRPQGIAARCSGRASPAADAERQAAESIPLDLNIATEEQMKRVTGIGGIFFKARDPVALRAWYKDHLGIDVQEWGGAAFTWTDADGKPTTGTTIWTIGDSEGSQFSPSTASFMVNYRVADLHELVAALKHEGCNILEKIEESEYGKFAWVIDPEGNKVELWEPPAGQ